MRFDERERERAREIYIQKLTWLVLVVENNAEEELEYTSRATTRVKVCE